VNLHRVYACTYAVFSQSNLLNPPFHVASMRKQGQEKCLILALLHEKAGKTDYDDAIKQLQNNMFAYSAYAT